MIQLTKNMTVGEHLTMYQEGDSNWFAQKWDVEDEPLVLGVSSKISDNNTLGYITDYSYSILHGGSRLGSEV